MSDEDKAYAGWFEIGILFFVAIAVLIACVEKYRQESATQPEVQYQRIQ